MPYFFNVDAVHRITAFFIIIVRFSAVEMVSQSHIKSDFLTIVQLSTPSLFIFQYVYTLCIIYLARFNDQKVFISLIFLLIYSAVARSVK